MPTYATPGVYFESFDQADQSLSAVRTDIAAFLGIAQRGPVHQPIPVNSWDQFQSTFGDFISNGYLAYAAKAFFENGGQTFYGVRVAAPKAGTVTVAAPTKQPPGGAASLVVATQGFKAGAVVTVKQSILANAAGAQPAGRQSSVVDTIGGFLAGSVVLVTQAAPVQLQSWHLVRAVDETSKTLYWDNPLEPQFVLAQPIRFQVFPRGNYLLRTVDAATSTLTWETPLVPVYNLNQPIQFETGAAAAEGSFYDARGNATLTVEAFSPGAWGNGLAVGIAPSSLAATATSAQPQPATGAVSFVESVVGLLPFSLVRVYQSHVPTPRVDYRVVTNVDFTLNALTWDQPLAPTFNLNLPISVETIEFSLTVYLDGTRKEIFAGLSLNPKHARYVEKVVNPPEAASEREGSAGQPSQYIRVKDLLVADPSPDNLPDAGALHLNHGVLNLACGRDGIAALRPMDFTGDAAIEEKWGLRTLEDVDEISIVAVPDILIEPAPLVPHAPLAPQVPDPCLPGSKLPTTAAPAAPQPVEAAPKFSLDEIFAVQQAVIEHCETMRFRFAILDPPDFGYPKEHVDLGEVQTWRNRFDTEFAALYYPWIVVRDPLRSGDQPVRRVPPSGHVAGVYAHTDLTEGVFKAPANTPLQWAQDVTTEISANMQGFLNPLGVDCLRVFPGRGIRIFGARTLSSDASWRFVNVRRLMSMIEHALLIALQWSVFEPNNNYLWHTVRTSASGFLEGLWEKGALAGNTAEEAFFVKCDLTNNPFPVTQAGQMILEIGVAPVQPAEFVVFRIGRTEDTLEISE